MLLPPEHPDYPRALCDLEVPPTIALSARLETRRAVAIVGARSAVPEACAFAFALAYHLGKAGLAVVSGGAVGVDRCAHEGALAAGGATWLVAPCGRGEVYPRENEDLFARIAADPRGRIVWPFADGTPTTRDTPRRRNGVLVGLAERVVVVQARVQSGSRNAATWARKLGRALHVLPATPWTPGFEGSVLEGANGARALWSHESFFAELGLPPPRVTDPRATYGGIACRPTPIKRHRTPVVPSARRVVPRPDPEPWTDDETAVFSAISHAPVQQDAIIERTGLGAAATLTALLTLSLRDVVVEGPDGFFRRTTAT